VKNLLIISAILFSCINLRAQDFPFLDTKAIGAKSFIGANPAYDGRGTVIFILDNSVDPMIPGLMKTSTGEVKVIDMQDFSGQVMLKYKSAEIEETGEGKTLVGDGIRLYGFESLNYRPENDKYMIAYIDEAVHYKNSSVKDLNDNGRFDDKFAIVTFPVENTAEISGEFRGMVKPEDKLWVYFVDEDGDGNINDESPKFNYKYNYDVFTFNKGVRDRKSLLTMSANILPDEGKIMINTGDGSHGSHCAGIAAGFENYGTPGNSGIAPGAYVVSLKIGNNLLSGGCSTTEAMKKAYEYGIKFMEEAGFDFGIYSMSYGIGAEQPGRTSIAEFLDKFAHENPNIVVVTSNGNNGPGINSTGTPAGAANVVSVGAMIPPDVLKNLYGSGRTSNWVTHFSSRGGESEKPDVMAPGAAVSTVPAFEGGERFWGTSMSCPQVAGACALLVSAAQQENVEITGSLLKFALKSTADKMAGYDYVDQGSGLVNIPEAWEFLKQVSKAGYHKEIFGYKISTANSLYPDMKGRAAFWRAGGYFPSGAAEQEVNIRAIFPDESSKDQNQNFFRAFSIQPADKWLSSDKDEIYIRGNNTANFSIMFDKSQLSEPGLYSSVINLVVKSEKGVGKPEIEVPVTLAIPHKANEDNNYEISIRDKSLGIGDIDRHFTEVPAGASSMQVKLSRVPGKHYGMGMYVFEPDGSRLYFGSSAEANDDKDIVFEVSGEALEPGMWEILPYCYYQSNKASAYNLDIRFGVLESDPETITKMNFAEDFTLFSDIGLVCQGNKPRKVQLSGQVTGYFTNSENKISGKSKFEKKINISDKIAEYRVKIELSEEDYAKITDMAVNIYDSKGKSVRGTGLGRKSEFINLGISKPGTYTLEIIPGFTSKKDEKSGMNIILEEEFIFNQRQNLKFNSEKTTLYPGLQKNIRVISENPLPMAPENFKSGGFIEIRGEEGMLLKKIPVRLD
jgi:tripeptidyl-peptidase-2